MKAMQKLTDTELEEMEYYTFRKLNFAGIKDVIFSTTGYTGSGGCEIYLANEDAPKIWKAVMEAGEEFGIKPIGLAARDTLRLEMDSVFMATILMMKLHPWKLDWDGLQNLKKGTILLTETIWKNKKLKG